MLHFVLNVKGQNFLLVSILLSIYTYVHRNRKDCKRCKVVKESCPKILLYTFCISLYINLLRQWISPQIWTMQRRLARTTNRKALIALCESPSPCVVRTEESVPLGLRTVSLLLPCVHRHKSLGTSVSGSWTRHFCAGAQWFVHKFFSRLFNLIDLPCPVRPSKVSWYDLVFYKGSQHNIADIPQPYNLSTSLSPSCSLPPTLYKINKCAVRDGNYLFHAGFWFLYNLLLTTVISGTEKKQARNSFVSEGYSYVSLLSATWWH